MMLDLVSHFSIQLFCGIVTLTPSSYTGAQEHRKVKVHILKGTVCVLFQTQDHQNNLTSPLRLDTAKSTYTVSND